MESNKLLRTEMCMLLVILMLSVALEAYCEESYQDDRSSDDSSSSSSAITGGILGKSAVSADGKTFDKNRNNPLAGTGIGGMSGALIGTKEHQGQEQVQAQAMAREREQAWKEAEGQASQDYQRVYKKTPKNEEKRIVDPRKSGENRKKYRAPRKYDDEGNIIPEEGGQD